MSDKKIFFLNILRPGAGMINREVGIAREFAKRGQDVMILSYFKPSMDTSKELFEVRKIWPVRYFSFLYENPLVYPFVFIYLLIFFWRTRPSKVFVDLHQEAMWAILFRSLFKYEVIFTYHGVAKSPLFREKVTKEYNRIREKSHQYLLKADKVIVVSDFLKQELEEIGCYAETVYNGVDLECFNPKLVYRSIKAIAPLLLFIGRYVEYKGAHYIVESFVEIAKQNSEVELIMRGVFESEEYQQKIENIITENGLSQRVHIDGPVDWKEMPKLINLATVFVNGSTYETFGMPLLEAQACGCPCVAFEAGGIPEVVNDRETGILAPPADCKKFAEAVIEIINDDELRDKMSKRAMDWSKRFSYENITDDLEKVLDEKA